MGSPELLYKSKMENVASTAGSATSNAQINYARPELAVTSSSDTALQFITCHHFIGSFCKSATPAHWHQDIEIIHCISGEGFNHICQGKSVSFNAPAIVIVPSNLIHRTCYPPHCRVNRIKFSPDVIRLHDSDPALESSLMLLQQGALRGSIIIGAHDSGFGYISALVSHLEELVAPLPGGSEQRVRSAILNRSDDMNLNAMTGKDARALSSFASRSDSDAAMVASSIEEIDEEEEERYLSQDRNGMPSTAHVTREQETQAAQQAHAEALAQFASFARQTQVVAAERAEAANAVANAAEQVAAQAAAQAAAGQGTTLEQNRLEEQMESTLNSMGMGKGVPNSLSAPANDDFGRNTAINAGSIAIAYASTRNRGESSLQEEQDQGTSLPVSETERKLCHSLGLRLQIKASLLHLMGALFENCYLVRNESMKRPRSSRATDDKLKELLQHIHENYNNPITITDLAQKLEVTNQYFCRIFKQMTDMSFIDYINELRLQKAAVDIATTKDSIRDISSHHGFETIGYFFKLFREHYHTTPIKYRKSFTDDNGQPIAALDYENGLMPITSLFDHEFRTPAAVEQKVRRLVAQAS